MGQVNLLIVQILDFFYTVCPIKNFFCLKGHHLNVLCMMIMSFGIFIAKYLNFIFRTIFLPSFKIFLLFFSMQKVSKKQHIRFWYVKKYEFFRIWIKLLCQIYNSHYFSSIKTNIVNLTWVGDEFSCFYAIMSSQIALKLTKLTQILHFFQNSSIF